MPSLPTAVPTEVSTHVPDLCPALAQPPEPQEAEFSVLRAGVPGLTSSGVRQPAPAPPLFTSHSSPRSQASLGLRGVKTGGAGAPPQHPGPRKRSGSTTSYMIF